MILYHEIGLETFMKSSIKIGSRLIGKEQEPFIIAEMSGNHNQSLEKALEIVDSVAESGASALKLQTYTPDTITLNIQKKEFQINDKNSLWDGQNLYDLYKKAYTPWDWHKPIFDRAKSQGLICFSSPFDESAVEFLEDLEVPAYKIASFENNHIPLIKKVARKGKPMIISTGMASISQLEEAVLTARENGCKDIILLKCTSTYPAKPSNSNIRTIPHLEKLFNCQVGLSDHTKGNGVAVASIALGATVIEKHFTLSRLDGGVDSAFSVEPNEMQDLVKETKSAWQSLGKIYYGPTEAEKKSLQFRRSIYIAQDINAGDIFSEKNIKVVRPSYGESPNRFEDINGKKSPRNYKKGDPFKFDTLFLEDLGNSQS